LRDRRQQLGIKDKFYVDLINQFSGISQSTRTYSAAPVIADTVGHDSSTIAGSVAAPESRTKEAAG